MKRVLVLNGPNLNLLGLREPELYGRGTYQELSESINRWAADCELDCEIVQSNHEGVLVDCIQAAYGHFDAILINAAAYTHTSVAILDALKAVGLPVVEVHLTDISAREDFRKFSYVSEVAEERIMGLGFEGYHEGLKYLEQRLRR